MDLDTKLWALISLDSQSLSKGPSQKVWIYIVYNITFPFEKDKSISLCVCLLMNNTFLHTNITKLIL